MVFVYLLGFFFLMKKKKITNGKVMENLEFFYIAASNIK